MRSYLVFVLLLIGFTGTSQASVLPRQPINRMTVIYPDQVIVQTNDFHTITRSVYYEDSFHHDTVFNVPMNIPIYYEVQLDGTLVDLPKRTSNLFPETSGVYVVPAYRGTINPNNKK